MKRSLKKSLGWLPLVAGATLGALWIVGKNVARPRRRRTSAALLRAIPGNDKAAVVAVFGPPRASAGFAALAPAKLVSADYVHADTWYYPLDRIAKTALVVHFDRDIARDAQLVCFRARISS